MNLPVLHMCKARRAGRQACRAKRGTRRICSPHLCEPRRVAQAARQCAALAKACRRALPRLGRLIAEQPRDGHEVGRHGVGPEPLEGLGRRRAHL